MVLVAEALGLGHIESGLSVSIGAHARSHFDFPADNDEIFAGKQDARGPGGRGSTGTAHRGYNRLLCTALIPRGALHRAPECRNAKAKALLLQRVQLPEIVRYLVVGS